MEDLFIKAVPGRLVTRFGTATPGRQSYIGAERVPERPDDVALTGRIVRIPAQEYGRYRREYDREIRAGALEVCSAAEYAAQEE